MKATTFPQFNLNLGAGNNPNTNDLQIAISTHPDPIYNGVVFLFSRWKLTEEERQRLLSGGEVWLGVMSTPSAPTQPPVLLTTNNPFSPEEGFEAIPAEDIIGDNLP